jgi:hypothetical protein
MPATPFWQPHFYLEIPPLPVWRTLPYLLGNPSFVSWCESLSTLDPGWLYTEPPHPPIPPLPFQQFPLLKCMPSQDYIMILALHSPIQ